VHGVATVPTATFYTIFGWVRVWSAGVNVVLSDSNQRCPSPIYVGIGECHVLHVAAVIFRIAMPRVISAIIAPVIPVITVLQRAQPGLRIGFAGFSGVGVVLVSDQCVT
jgi:hypothetical protein